MKKILAFLTIILMISLVSVVQSQGNITVTIASQVDTTIDGLTHRKITGTIEKDGVTSNQVINVLSGNPFTDPTLQVIVGDDYPAYSYGMRQLHSMAVAVDNRYPHYKVLGGINGDFYNMTIGIPVEVYIRNGENVSPGLGYNRDVIGFKEDGTVVFGRPCIGGFEIRIYDSAGRERINLPVARINKLPFDDREVTVFFQDHTVAIPSGYTKTIINATEIKRDAYNTRYFGKGGVGNKTTAAYTVPTNKFIVVSDNPYVRDMMQTGDTVLVQQKIGCSFEGVRWAIGTWEKLVENSQALTNIPQGTAITTKNPRTAIGVREDHTVFFVTVDGRLSSSGMDGVTLYELASLMEYFGAKTAYNLDGGGSTSMVVRNASNTFTYTNVVTNSTARSLSNGIFFVRGTAPEVPPVLPIPDLSVPLETPKNLHIDSGLMLRWDNVASRIAFIVSVDGEEYPTASRALPVGNFEPGIYTIKVKATGDGFYNRDSEYTEPLQYIVYPQELAKFYALFKSHARNRIAG